MSTRAVIQLIGHPPLILSVARLWRLVALFLKRSGPSTLTKVAATSKNQLSIMLRSFTWSVETHSY